MLRNPGRNSRPNKSPVKKKQKTAFDKPPAAVSERKKLFMAINNSISQNIKLINKCYNQTKPLIQHYPLPSTLNDFDPDNPSTYQLYDDEGTNNLYTEETVYTVDDLGFLPDGLAQFIPGFD